MATRCKIRKDRGSAQFAGGETVYVNMDRDSLRRAIARARDPEESDDAAQQVWIMEDPTTGRGSYGFVADLEMPRGSGRRKRSASDDDDHAPDCSYAHGMGPCDCWQA